MIYSLYTRVYDNLLEFPAYVKLLKMSVKDVIGNNILEAGAGTGNTLVYLKDKKVYCVDIDDVRLKQAEAKKGKNHVLMNASVENLPFKQKQFDTVLCINTLNFVGNDNKALSEFFRVLKKKGRLILHVPKKDSNSFEMISRGVKSLGFFKFIRFLPSVIIISLANAALYKNMRKYSVRNLKQKLKKHGFLVKKLDNDSYLGQGIYCVAERI